MTKFLFQSCLILLGIVPALAETPNEEIEDLRAHWRLDDGAELQVSDSSGNDNTGQASEVRWINGVHNASLQINWQGWVKVEDDDSLDVSDGLTLETWVKVWNPRYAQTPVIIRKQGAYALYFDRSKSVTFSIWVDGKEQKLSTKHKTWPNGRWEHIVGTFDGQTMRVYVNGELDNERELSSPKSISNSKSPLYLGSLNRRMPLSGTLDEVIVAGAPRSAEAIYDSHESGRFEIERAQSRFTSFYNKSSKRTPKEVVDGYLWIDAEDFQDYGGWWMDTQFVPQMGSPFLLAAGIGYPVEDATTSVDIDQAGDYRLWVRSRNWLPEHTPGKFEVVIGGDKSNTVFGTDETDDWVWQDGGTFNLEKGELAIAIKDLTGYYGRCDALLLTRDLSYEPPTELASYKAERDRLTGKETDIAFMGDFDVVVVGGGVAGTNAAIAAARNGAKTALIQDRPMLGGNNSAELGVPVLGPADFGQKNARESGLNEEIGRYQSFNFLSKWSTASQKIAEKEENLTLFLNTHVYDAEMDGNTIVGVRAFDMITAKLTRYTGKIFIDCTGDGWLGYYAGAEYMFGREAKDTFGESNAPDKADDITMSGSLFQGSVLGYNTKDTGEPYDMDSPEWLWDLSYNTKNLEARKGYENTYKSGTWWHENRGDVDDLWDPESARDGLIRVSLSYMNWIKTDSNKADNVARNRKIIALPVTNAKRETRRLVGDHILTQDEVLEATIFPDRIATGGWGLDIHHPDGIFSTEGPFDFNTHTPMYSIPFRMLYSKNISNLMFAGRDVSCSRVALGTVRVQGTTGVMGQAVGTAAAMCAKYDTNPRGIYEKHITELQQELLKDDQYIIKLKNEDPNDLALKAKISASSSDVQEGFSKEDVVAMDKSHPLNTRRAMMFGAGELSQIDSVSVLLESTNSDETEVTLDLQLAAEYGNFEWIDDLASADALVPANGRTWVTFEFNQPVSSKFLKISMDAHDGISWVMMENGPISAGRAYYDAAQERWNPVQGEYYAFHLGVPINPNPAYSPSNVISGVSRIVDGATNMWKSDATLPMPQWLEVDFGSPEKLNSIYLTFDTNVNQAKHQTWEFKDTDRMVPESVRDYEIFYEDGDGWVSLGKTEDNYQRRRIHRFSEVETSKFRVVVNQTNGDKAARIYEVRAYNE
ncbi:MAG: FAD-dependent oxidoreductase [Verrucomicrobiota bacterium]